MLQENEKQLTFLEVKKLIKRFKGNIKKLNQAIEQEIYGVMFLYIHNNVKVIVKRYRTGKFIAVMEGV